MKQQLIWSFLNNVFCITRGFNYCALHYICISKNLIIYYDDMGDSK